MMLTNRSSNQSQIYPNVERMSMEDDSTSKKDYTQARILQTVIDLAVIIIIFVIFILVFTLMPPRTRYMTCADYDIFYPYKQDTIPFWAVGIFATIGPLLVILLVEILNLRLMPCHVSSKRRSCRAYTICVFHAISLFVLGISITLLLTELGKRWVGRLRPHFIAVCLPNISKINCTSTALNGFVYNPVDTGGDFCTGDASSVKEARFSFPSGHSSYSWYCMVFIIFYLEARLVLLRFRYVKPLIQMAAFIAAFITCLSRVSDYHHRGSDVIGGTVLGWVIGVFITTIVGRVLWLYETEANYAEFDLKPRKVLRI